MKKEYTKPELDLIDLCAKEAVMNLDLDDPLARFEPEMGWSNYDGFDE